MPEPASPNTPDFAALLRQQTTLARFGESALRSDDLDEILTDACRLIGEALGTDLAKVVELQPDGRTLRVRAGVGWPPGVVGVATVALADDSSESYAIRTGEPVISPDIEREQRFRYPDFLIANGVKAVANVVIIGAKGRPPFGILQIDSRTPRAFTDSDTAFLRGYANLIASAVDRLRALAEAREAASRLRALNADLERQVIEQAHERGRMWHFSPDLFSIIDLGTATFEKVNPAWTAALGWAQGEMEGKPCADFVHPDDAGASAAAFDRLRRGAPILRFENRYRAKDGGWHFLSWVALPEGEKLYSTTRDVTVQKAQEEALKARTAEHNRLWETTNDLMGMAGLDGYLKAVNPAWTRILGWDETELLSRPFTEMVEPEDRAATDAVVRRLAAGQRVTEFVNRIYHKDGSQRTLMWTAVPENDVYYKVGRDVTELRQTEDQLRQSQKMEAVGQLTGGLAHDFNNLLAGITGSLELLQARIAQGRVADSDRYVEAAQLAAKRAAALTHRLLAFSRRQTLDPKPTDANRLVLGMEELIRRTVGPAITLEVDAAASLWPTLVDPPQLENALLNLCLNARDSMPDGGRIMIETANTRLDERAAQSHDLPAAEYVSLCVTDTGSGMPPDVVARAFDPFFTTKPIGEGTGLGLSMIYGFTRQSGGQVRIYSEQGQGTTVCLYLPRYLGEADRAELPPALADAPRAMDGETVLVVDDEPIIRMLVTEVLDELGYTAIEAQDGAEGLGILRSGARIDLLVTDVGLPGGFNGRQMAEAGRLLRPELKVLFITGYAENAALSHGHLGDGMHVLTKPFAMEALASRIKALIGTSAHS